MDAPQKVEDTSGFEFVWPLRLAFRGAWELEL